MESQRLTALIIILIPYNEEIATVFPRTTEKFKVGSLYSLFGLPSAISTAYTVRYKILTIEVMRLKWPDPASVVINEEKLVIEINKRTFA